MIAVLVCVAVSGCGVTNRGGALGEVTSPAGTPGAATPHTAAQNAVTGADVTRFVARAGTFRGASCLENADVQGQPAFQCRVEGTDMRLKKISIVVTADGAIHATAPLGP